MAESDGLAEFVAARQGELLRFAWGLTGDWQRAEDLAQTALARMLPRWERVDDPWPYLQRTTVSVYATWWRRRWRGEIPTGDMPEQAAPDQFDEVDEHDTVGRWLRVLPVRQRAVIVARYVGDLSVEDTAQALGCSAGTVKSQTAKALHRLRLTVPPRENKEGVR